MTPGALDGSPATQAPRWNREGVWGYWCSPLSQSFLYRVLTALPSMVHVRLSAVQSMPYLCSPVVISNPGYSNVDRS